MDVYLQRSEIVRDIFDMGAPLSVDEAKDNRPTKQAKVGEGKTSLWKFIFLFHPSLRREQICSLAFLPKISFPPLCSSFCLHTS